MEIWREVRVTISPILVKDLLEQSRKDSCYKRFVRDEEMISGLEVRVEYVPMAPKFVLLDWPE